MTQLKNLAHRLVIKVVSNVITFAYNPHQTEIFQLLWNIYDLSSTFLDCDNNRGFSFRGL